MAKTKAEAPFFFSCQVRVGHCANGQQPFMLGSVCEVLFGGWGEGGCNSGTF